MAGISLEPVALAGSDLNRLTDSGELALIKLLAEWPRLLESAAEAHEPHRVAFYLYDLAAAFHGQWNKGNERAELRFLLPDDPALTGARLALVQRSEEHTSELQSLMRNSYAVFCLKKKKQYHTTKIHTN